ncbi:hypothetical protein GCM10015535_03010 [Streptomyces gelaticus]|uniref:Uncharacterized protein n=1 Tax=Streptomyces gelaticus TaxID=285446 RepID=A0ABQ2VQH0_9ACTN|nr:hypothetical protein [Streptomyces gelaticus]GGV74345.1 hypothetical protein GCM10015535_03010 [Streptomyces gelaticus]
MAGRQSRRSVPAPIAALPSAGALGARARARVGVGHGPSGPCRPSRRFASYWQRMIDRDLVVVSTVGSRRYDVRLGTRGGSAFAVA